MAANPNANYINPEEPHAVSFYQKEELTQAPRLLLMANTECSICGSHKETDICIRRFKANKPE